MVGKSHSIFVMETLPTGKVLVGIGQGPWKSEAPRPACCLVCGDISRASAMHSPRDPRQLVKCLSSHRGGHPLPDLSEDQM